MISSIIILIVILIVVIVAMRFFIKRNENVCKYRIGVINKHGCKTFNTIHSYDTMLFKFWIPLIDENWINTKN